MKEIATLKGLLLRQLQSVFEAENSWSAALADTVKVISDPELKRLFETNSKASAGHAGTVQNLLRELGGTSLDKRNAVAEDLIRELREIQETAADREVLDAGLIVTHQCMNHYLMAKYGTATSYANLLQDKQMASVLHLLVEEEKKEDSALSWLAEKHVNEKARAAIIL